MDLTKEALVKPAAKEKVQEDDSSLEFDRPYVPGHDSLSEGEKLEEEIRSSQLKKKLKGKRTQKKVAFNTERPRTRSRDATPSITQVKVL